MKLHTRLAFLSCTLGLVSAAAKFPPWQTDKVTFFASTLVERDVDLGSFLNAYDKAVRNVTTYVNAFSSNPTNEQDFRYAAAFLIGVMDGGRDAIKNAGSVTISDESINTAQTVQTDVKSLVSDLASRKSVFESAGFCTMLQTFTSDLVSHNEDLTSTLLANVASEYQDTTRQITSDINNNYSKAKSNFANGNCVDGSGSSSSIASITNPSSTSPTSPSQTSQTSKASGPSQAGGSSQTSHTSTPLSQNPGSGSQNNLSAGAKVGIGVGVSSGVLMLIGGGLGIWLCRRRRQPQGQVAFQTQGYPTGGAAPPLPEVEDTGKTELGVTQLAGSPQGASLITTAPVLLGDAAGAPRWEMDNNSAVRPVWELPAHPYHVYDTGDNQQQQQASQIQNHPQAERPVVTTSTLPPNQPHSTLTGATSAPSSGEEALVQSRELLREARQQLDEFITTQSKPHSLPKERPTNIQLASVLHGQGGIESKAKFIANEAPPLMVESLIAQYYHRVTPAHLRPIYASHRSLYADDSGQMSFQPWWGAPRLYEREDPSSQSSTKETIGYHWRYDHGERHGGPSTYVDMTVSAEGNVQLSSGPTSSFPATAEGFTALLKKWDNGN